MIVIDTINENDIKKTYDEFLEKYGNNIKEMYVPYGPDMFLLAYSSVVVKGYQRAFAVDKQGKIVAVLSNELSSYVHQYKKTGFLDLWVLDCYDGIFLHDCNEYSVILLQEALKEWQGKRIVLVGENWEQMLPMLELPQTEICYEAELSPVNMQKLLEEIEAPLQIMFGHPHNEPLDRFLDGILYYAEVMTFVYFFSDYRSMGELNEDKKFFVVDGRYGNLGLYALFDSVKHVIRYVKARGFIPIVRITKSENSFYSDGPADDIWEKFFCQPEPFSLKAVLESKNVYFSPGFYNGRIMNYLMDMISEDIPDISWPNGIYNDAIKTYVEERIRKFLQYPDETIGVLARGTDYVNTHLANHPIHATKEMICDKIEEIMSEDPNIKNIYLATEDSTYPEYFVKRFGDKVSFTDQQRYSVLEGQMLADLHRQSRGTRKGFDFGAEYVASVTLLSKCRRLLASGACGGVSEAIRLNEGKYTDVYVFDLGCNPG